MLRSGMGMQPGRIDAGRADAHRFARLVPYKEAFGRMRGTVLSFPAPPLRYPMAFSQRGSMLGSILGILVCGVAGGIAAWSGVNALGIDGVSGALLAAVIGMVVATALWAGGSSLLRALGWIR